MSSAVIAYDRPLAPGTVRITGSSAGITIRIAPQGSRRVFLAVLIPAIVAAASLALAAFGLLSGGAGDTGLPILIVLGVSAGYLVYRMVLRSADPIEIFADPKSLRMLNPLEEPTQRTVAVAFIAVVQLRRMALHSGAYELEIACHDFPGQPSGTCSILSSTNYETLDYIGRSIVRAIGFPEPTRETVGWASVPAAMTSDLPPAL